MQVPFAGVTVAMAAMPLLPVRTAARQAVTVAMEVTQAHRVETAAKRSPPVPDRPPSTEPLEAIADNLIAMRTAFVLDRLRRSKHVAPQQINPCMHYKLVAPPLENICEHSIGR